jgi:cytochrome oxidase Cu insertion factor (SCO1/SenC/PrrC family)
MHLRLSGLLLLVAVLFTVAALLLLAPAAQAASPALTGPTGTSSLTMPRGAPSLLTVAADRPDWLALPIVDARTGQTFTMADFAGTTVYVEPMATWCTNCRQQMGTIRDGLLAQLDPERTVVLGLSVETDLPREDLAAYVDKQGFSWQFAVMTPELLQALAATYGQTITNPPAVPHFVIGPDGSVSDLSTGFHTADQLLGELTAAGGSGQ